MPIIQSAKKRMRQERKRTAINKVKRVGLKSLIKKVRIDKSATNLTAVFSTLDKAAKTGLIHKNKAARLKSRLSKGNSGRTITKPVKKASKKKTTKTHKK
mgnify:CR=1 FL=1